MVREQIFYAIIESSVILDNEDWLVFISEIETSSLFIYLTADVA
jgi:hypothetical protein